MITEYPQGDELGQTTVRSLKNLKPWFDTATRGRPKPGEDPGPEFRYSYDIATAPGSKLLGYAQWIQGPEVPNCACGTPMQLLATVASQEDHGSAVWNTRPSQGPDNPSEFSFGDWSNAYVFYCDKRHPIRIQALTQSS